MGQAKNRGTYEQRVEQAQEAARLERIAEAERERVEREERLRVINAITPEQRAAHPRRKAVDSRRTTRETLLAVAHLAILSNIG